MTYSELVNTFLKTDMTEAQLLELNKLVCAEIRARRSRTIDRAKYAFRVGQKVSFTDKQGRTLTGTVTKINPKTIKVTVPSSRGVGTVLWTVTPTLLRAA